MNVGLRFKRIRENRKLTQREAAELIGVKYYQLGNYETNRSEPNIETLKKMSEVYKTSIDNLVGNTKLIKNAIAEGYINDEDEVIDIKELTKNLKEIVEKIEKEIK